MTEGACKGPQLSLYPCDNLGGISNKTRRNVFIAKEDLHDFAAAADVLRG
jgi:hypothetical protein